MRMPRTLGVSLAVIALSTAAMTEQAQAGDPTPQPVAKAQPRTVSAAPLAGQRQAVTQLATSATGVPNLTPGRGSAGFGEPDRYIAQPGQRQLAAFRVVGQRVIGHASWYGNYHLGRRTATGERLDSVHPTAAHRTLPMHSLVKVTNLRNGRSVVVTINDRGPVSPRLSIDVSPRAADELQMRHDGIVPVAIEQVAVARTPQ